ncbi:MAG: hypothetical protein ABID64_02585 [Nitrospirota bacterium]
MNIRKLLNSLFQEKRLLQINREPGPSGAPATAPKPKLNTPQKLEAEKQKLRGVTAKQRQQIEPERGVKNPKEDAVDKYLDTLDDKKFDAILRTGSVMVQVGSREEVLDTSAFSTEQVDKIVAFAVKTTKNLKAFLDDLSTQSINKKIRIEKLSDKSRTALINATKDKPTELKPLFEKLLSASVSADQTIATVEKNFQSDKTLVNSMIEIILSKKDFIQKLSPTSIATFLNVTTDKETFNKIFNKLDNRKLSLLLFTQLKPELKINIFLSLTNGLEELVDEVALENLVLFVYANPNQLNLLIPRLIENPKIIEKIGLAGCIKLVVETFGKPGQENLQKQLLANISGANKLSIYNIKSIPVAIRMAIYESFNVDMKKGLKKPKTADQLRTENQNLLKKEKTDYLKKYKTGEQKIASVPGFSIVGRDIKFGIKGVDRSFKKSARFLNELAKPEYDSAIKVKLACYRELLRIITADNSIKTNRHKLKGDWKGSNTELQASLTKYSEMITKLDKGGQAPDKRTMSGKVTITPPAAAPVKAGVQPGTQPANAKKGPAEKLKPQQIHERILANLKEQGIRIILPTGTKLPLLKATEAFDGLRRPTLKIQRAVMDAKDLGELSKVLKENGQKIKNYVEKVLKLNGVKIEITVNVTKKLNGKETKISKTIVWDQNNPENGGFVKVGAEWLLGKKGKTTYKSSAELLLALTGGAPTKPEPSAPTEKPKMAKGSVSKKPSKAPVAPAQKPKEIIAPTEKEAITKTIEKIQSVATSLGKSTDKSLGETLGIDAGRKITISTTPEGSGMYPIYIDGQKSNYIVGIFTVPAQAPNTGFKSLFSVRRKDQSTVDTFTSGDEQGVKDELTNAIKSVSNRQELTPEKRKKAIENLKTRGLNIVLPQGNVIGSLTVGQFKVLSDTLTKVQTTITEGTNVHQIIKKLKEVGQRLKSFSKPNFQDKGKFEFSIGGKVLTWDPNVSAANGFGVMAKGMKWATEKAFTKSALVAKITEFKKAQLTPHQFKIFQNQNEIREIEIKRENAGEKRLERYKQNYKTLAGKKFMIDKQIGDLDGDQIGILWPRFTGYKRVNAILGKSPFNVKERLQARTGAKLIAGENFTNLNDRIDFEDVFNHLKNSPALRGKSIIPTEYLKNYKTFIKKVDELTKSKKDPELLEAMFKDVLAPAFELMEAMSKLRFTAVSDEEHKHLKEVYYSGGERFKDPMEIAKDSIPQNQMNIVKGLQTLLGYSEKSAGSWKKFLGWLGGGKSEMYLADMDGNSFKVDEGMFQRYFSPKAALFMLLEKNGLYTIENGKKKLNGPAILKEVNNMLKRGYIAQALNRLTPKGQKPNKEQYLQAVKKIENGLPQYQITSFNDIANLKGTHKMAFQLGFVSMQTERMENQVRKGLDAKIDAGMALKGKDPSKVTEGERVILRKLIRGGLSEKVVAEVHSSLLFAGYMHFNSKGEFQGAGIGKSIKLSDGSSLLIGGGATKQGLSFGIGLNIRVTKLEGGQIDFNTVISVSGVAAGFSASHDVGKGVQASWFAGVGMSWTNMLNLGLSAGVGLDWDQAFVNLSKERSRKKVEKETGWGKTIKEWAGKSPSEKMQTLRKLPQWQVIENLMARFPKHMTQANLLRAYNMHFENLNAKMTQGAENLVPLIPVGINTGAILAGTIAGGPVGAIVGAIAGIKFRLGTVAVFIPKPSETQRILSLASSNRVEAKIRAKLKLLAEQLKEGTIQNVKFTETTGVVFNRPGSKLGKGLRIGKRQVARLNNFKTTVTGIEINNDALKEAEVQLQKTADGRIELKIQNLYNSENVADKDLELHIDPTLKKLGVIVEKGRIFLEGDIDNLIITRERFMFSHQQESGRPSIRDVITIRQSSSFEGKQKVTREWLMKNEGSFVEILAGHKDFGVQDGYSAETTKHLNIMTMHAGVKNLQGWLKDSYIKKLYANRPDIFKPGGEKLIKAAIEANKNLDKIKNDIIGKGGMHEALKVQTEKEFETQKLRPNPKEFYSKIRDAYNDKEFFKKYEKITNDPDKISQLLKEKFPNFNEREFTTAENYLRNLWFVTAYRAKGYLFRLGKLGVDKPLRKKLVKAGFWAISRLDGVSANEIVKKSKGQITQEEAQKIITAVKQYKERPMKSKEIFKKNKELVKRIRRFKKWVTDKYIQEFSDKIDKIDWGKGEKPDAKTLVNVFMMGIFDTLIAKLLDKENPLDFRNVKLEEIPQGSTLLSGSRIHKAGKEVRAFTNTVSYEGTKKGATQVHGYGFLKGYGITYSLDSKIKEHKQIAKILLETASPIPKDNTELLKSSFALKILGLGAYRFIAGGENYKAMIEIVKNPDLATSKEQKYVKAMKQFRELVEAIRAKQIEGEPYVQKVGKYTITIDMSATTVKSGAFSKCTNASFYVYEGGKAKVEGQRKRRKTKVIGARTESVQVSKSRTDIASISFSIAGGFTHKFSKKPKEDGKHHEGGPSEPPPEEGKEQGGGPAITESAGGRRVTTSGQGSLGGSPSGH